MTIRTMLPSRNVLLFWGLNLALLLGAFVLIIEPLQRFFTLRSDEILQKRDELARYDRLALADQSVRSLLEQVRNGQSGFAFLAGPDINSASAWLQSHIKERAAEAGLSVRSIAGIDPQVEHGLTYVGVRLDLSGPINSLHTALRIIEKQLSPALTVRTLAIRAPASTEGISGEVMLNVQIEVYGAVPSSSDAQ